ncbi:MAG: zinc ribbon domain-containing protein [Deltaproteobacteria bacterium]|nr:zinc ribbon domain-containing protein [Deltaproteobacteria bacterium]
MPIYEYACDKCQNEFELLVFRSDDPVCCPRCQSNEVHRLMSGFAHKTEGGRMVSSSGGCASCGGGSCATCH